MDEIIVKTDANGNASVTLPPEFIGKTLVLDLVPPSGYRDTESVEVAPLVDGEVRTVLPFRLEPQSARLHASVVDSAGAPLAGVAVVIAVKAG